MLSIGYFLVIATTVSCTIFAVDFTRQQVTPMEAKLKVKLSQQVRRWSRDNRNGIKNWFLAPNTFDSLVANWFCLICYHLRSVLLFLAHKLHSTSKPVKCVDPPTSIDLVCCGFSKD